MSKLRVLLIDDDELVRATISNCLISAGYEVAEAPDGKLGLAAFKAGRCDLVIVDILMPEKEGIETIREMRQLDAALPIIAISRSEEHTSELQSLMRISYAVFCLK